jgi:hypothetical protein
MRPVGVHRVGVMGGTLYQNYGPPRSVTVRVYMAK